MEDIAIGAAKQVWGAVLFFDICGFSKFTMSGQTADFQRALLLLNTVIPLMMSIVYDHGGYVEKNTGDGLMAVIGAGAPREEAVNSTLDVAATMRYALDALVNPQLRSLGLPEIQIRIAADWGILLLARIGVPTGRADQPRSYLTAVGAAANHASKLVEDAAKPGDILVGDFIKAYANPNRADWFLPATPAGWAWYYINTGSPYWVWRYTEARSGGLDALLRSALEPYRGL